MFSLDLDRSRHPLSARSRGIVLGSIILVGVAAALVSARTVAFLYPSVIAGFLISAYWRGQLDRAASSRGPVFWHLALFLAYALASAAWAIEWRSALAMVSLATAVAMGTLILVQLITDETRPNLLHMAEGLWIGFLVGLLYLFIELITSF